MTIKDFRARPLLLTGTYIHSTPVVGCRSRPCAVAVGRSRTSLPRDREAVVPCTFHTLDLVVPPQRHDKSRYCVDTYETLSSTMVPVHPSPSIPHHDCKYLYIA